MSRAARSLATILTVLTVAHPSSAAEPEKNRCVTAAEAVQAERGASKLVSARRQALVCARDVCPPVVRNDCTRWLLEIDASLPSITVRARAADGQDVFDATLKVDGEVVQTRLDGKPVVIDPGERAVRVEAVGHRPVEQRILAVVGESTRAILVNLPGAEEPAGPARPGSAGTVAARASSISPVTPAAEDRRATRRTWGIVAGSLGLASLGGFAGLQLKAQGDYSDLRDGCGRSASCGADQVSEVRTYFVASGVALAAGVVLLGAAAWLVFGGPR